MTPMEKKVSNDLKKALTKKELRDRLTSNIYVVETRRKVFGMPFFACSDKVALDSLKELAKQIPDLQRTNLYRIGTYCTLDAKIKSTPKTLII